MVDCYSMGFLCVDSPIHSPIGINCEYAMLAPSQGTLDKPHHPWRIRPSPCWTRVWANKPSRKQHKLQIAKSKPCTCAVCACTRNYHRGMKITSRLSHYWDLFILLINLFAAALVVDINAFHWIEVGLCPCMLDTQMKCQIHCSTQLMRVVMFRK